MRSGMSFETVVSRCIEEGLVGGEGFAVDASLISADANKQPLWIIARQHPGETMAEWFVEGMLERLIDGNDPIARALLDTAVLHVVPNMNPDGSVRGSSTSSRAIRRRSASLYSAKC